jgi:hypothetical protein
LGGVCSPVGSCYVSFPQERNYIFLCYSKSIYEGISLGDLISIKSNRTKELNWERYDEVYGIRNVLQTMSRYST